MNALEAFVDQAWSDHADQPEAVAARLSDGLALAQDDAGVGRLAGLAHHVLGEHLARWQAGLDFLGQLAALGVHGPEGAATIARCRASLRLCSGAADERGPLSPGEQCRVTTMAACNLAAFDTTRAAALLQDAVNQAAALPDTDPGVRALAAHGNGIAGTLQERPARDAAQRQLMLDAAQVARTHWQRAGTWLEVERAEYRLALCWLAAGDAAQALQHARRCETLVLEHGALPLELFFAAEALAGPALALGDTPAHAAAVTTARQAYAALPADDQAWCRATLDRLVAA